MTLDWNDLRFVLAAGRHLSLGGAAKSLGVTRGTVSRRLDAVEEALGVQLFERTGQGLSATPAGLRVLERADGVAVAVTGLEDSAKAAIPDPRGVVRVSASSTLASEVLTPSFGSLLGAHPELEVHLIDDASVVSLERGEADVAVRMLRPERQRLVCTRIGPVELLLAASSSYLAEHGRPTGPSGFAGHRLITYGPPLELLPEARWMAEQNGRVVLRTSTLRAQLQAVRNGLGLALLPRIFVVEQGIQVVAEVPLARHVWVVAHEQSRTRPAVRAVYDHIVHVVRERLANTADHLSPS